MASIIKYIHAKLLDVITHTCSNFNRGLVDSLRPSDAYICVSKPATSGSDKGLSPGPRQTNSVNS